MITSIPNHVWIEFLMNVDVHRGNASQLVPFLQNMGLTTA